MFDPKDEISKIFEKGQEIVDKEIEDKGIKIERPTLSDFKERVKKIIIENYSKKKIDIIELDEGYETALSLVPNMNYSLEDVINLIHEYQNEEFRHGFYSPGIYLSALINKVIKSEDVVSINFKDVDDDRKIFFENIGMFLSRGKLVVNGDAYGALGYRMSGGELILKGKCYGSAGVRMKDGRILIEKNISESYSDLGPAYEMEGGEIEILGNANIWDHGMERGGVGYKMKGGKVIIHGDVYDVGYKMEGGEIIIKRNSIKHQSGIGNYMKGGTIKVENFATGLIGWRMEGGNIIIYEAGNSDESASIGADMYGGNIKVEKNAYACIGDDMIDGNIEICGDLKLGGHIGWKMQDGSILVKGNVYSSPNADIGMQMKGGRIHIKGNVDGKVGDQMEGGTIEIDGYMPPDKSYKFTEKPIRYGGSVYNRGRLVKENIATKIGKLFNKK